MNYGIQEVFMNEVLNNYFSGQNDYNILLGLGLSNEGGSINTDDFIEPSEDQTGYFKQPFRATTAKDGICYNAAEICFETALKDWTIDGRVIDKIGLFYRITSISAAGIETTQDVLWCVLPLNPVETVIAGDTVIIPANSIRLQLTNK